MKTIINIVLAVNLFCLTACYTPNGTRTARQFSKISDTPCEERSQNVQLFFEGENIDFQYVKLGFVEASGVKNSTSETVLDHLRYEAWKNCADGIISVKRAVKEREMGYTPGDKNEIYSSTLFTGIAVKIKRDSSFLAKYGNKNDTTFVKTVNKEINPDNHVPLGAAIFTTLLFTAYLVSNTINGK
jgi:hypothetical protein